MKWTSREIDERNQLYGIMRYQIKFGLPAFFDARNWCWEHLGPGIEYEHFINFTLTKHAYNNTGSPEIHTDMEVPQWCWDATKWKGSAISTGKIYIRSGQDMALFTLRWS